MAKKHSALLALLLTLAMLLSACAKSVPEESQDQPLQITAAVSGVQETLDPAFSTAPGSETVLGHLYENLMTWTDDGTGRVALVPGQAESYQMETDFAGNATYTFTLREGLQWSDGEPLTAQDFVNAWRRLADPATASPHGRLLRCIAGYDKVQETGNPAMLQVGAHDERTLVVHLNGSCAYFLEEICAGAYTVPVRCASAPAEETDAKTDSAASALKPVGDMTTGEGVPTNGPYTLAEFARGISGKYGLDTPEGADTAPRENGSHVTVKKSETYWDHKAVGPDTITFVTADSDRDADWARFNDNELDLVWNLPKSALEALLEKDPNWLPDPVTSVYAIAVNTEAAPFDHADVRTAFRLAVSNTALLETLGDPTMRSAFGLVPYGITDYGQRTCAEKPEDSRSLTAPPNPNTCAEEPISEPWDFRAHSLEKVTVPELTDYEEDCREAKDLMAKAGYPGGAGFPEVTYIYPDCSQGRAAAMALAEMWHQVLGVTVEVKALTQEEYLAAINPEKADKPAGEGEEAAPAYHMAGQLFESDYCDAGALLERWRSGHPQNLANYWSEAYDILMDSARAAVSPEARDAYLHDAEAILLQDSPVIPLCYPGISFALNPRMEGLFRGPDGVFFLKNVHWIEE